MGWVFMPGLSRFSFHFRYHGAEPVSNCRSFFFNVGFVRLPLNGQKDIFCFSMLSSAKPLIAVPGFESV